MAIAPQNEDAFLREVDENLRHDQMMGFFRRWGGAVAGVVGALLLLLAAGLWWRSHRATQAGVDSESLAVAIAPLDSGGAPDSKALATLAASPRDAYRDAARLAQAGAMLQRGDIAGAASAYRALANDGTVAQPLRDLATLRAVSAEFDTLAPQKAIDQLKTLAIVGNPYFAGAAEMTGVAWLKQNRPDKAAPLFAAIVRDTQAPASIRDRAAMMATSLGAPIEPAPPAGVQ